METYISMHFSFKSKGFSFKSSLCIALRKEDSSYALNGQWDLQAAGTYSIAGTLFNYSPSDGTRGERLDAPGPLLEQLDLMVLYNKYKTLH